MGFSLAGLPSPALFGALSGSLLYAVSGRGPVLAMPRYGSTLGQAIIGVAMGVLIDLPTLGALAGHWLPILTVCFTTLGVSLLVGRLLALAPGVAPATGVFALIAGGASGVTAVARELGADDRVVGVIQYLRVVVILLGMPVITSLVFSPPQSSGGLSDRLSAGSFGTDLLFVAVAVVVGLGLARLVPFPAVSLLAPLIVSVPLSLSGLFGQVGVPVVLQTLGYALIGAQVGLRFTAASLRQIARLLPWALALIALLIVVSAGLGVVLAAWTRKSALDGYLATTPGGLYAVLATAADSGADVTFVLAVQVIRLVVMLAAAPAIAAYLRRTG